MSETAQYLSQIKRAYARADATEHTYRPYLQDLLESILSGYKATNEAKRKVYGAPDFIVSKGSLDVGHLEVKYVGFNLDKVLKTDQWQRYTNALGNLILSDYLEFRWYVRGKLRRTVRIADLFEKTITPKANAHEELMGLLQAFVQNPTPAAGSAKELAMRLAYYAQQIRAVIRRVLREELKLEKKPLTEQFLSVKTILVAELTREEFADLYAQTLTYGLFATRIQQDEPDTSLGELSQFAPDYTERTFTRATPLLGIRGNAVLTQIFSYFGGAEAHPDFVWALEEASMVLDSANMESIKAELGKTTGAGDPVLHFYETFLAAYDKAMREKRGVYYTPEPVVGYIVRSVDYILKTRFDLKKGLADSSKTADGVHKVQVLDPATGTGTFLHRVINQIYSGFSSNQGMWNGYVKEHLLPRLHGFEFLIAPYTLAHLKLDFLLSRTGYTLQKDERVRVFLTNTLEQPRGVDEAFQPFAAALQQESLAASSIKRDTPVMVVLGNPPYSGHSANTGDWIHGLLHGLDSLNNNTEANYFEIDGMPLGEANSKWLNDDYVKFIRFAQWRIDKTGAGVLAFVTNHGYLDNPTFRGMRQALLKSFDELYFLDLHGNSRKKETAPDGSKDENVFDIMQGVAIGFFIKLPPDKKPPLELGKRVYHANLWGLREVFEGKAENAKLTSGKYFWLEENDIKSTTWTEIFPTSPFYLFVPQDVETRAEYQKGWGVLEMFERTLLGPNSHRDDFAIAFDKSEAIRRINVFLDKSITDAEIVSRFELKDNRDWKLSTARKKVPPNAEPVLCMYRPFDFRWMLYGDYAFDYHRPEINDHLLKNNFALVTTRQTKDNFSILMINLPAGQHKLVTPYDGSYVSPLYLYPNTEGLALETEARKANLSVKFIAALTEILGLEWLPDGSGDLEHNFAPEDVLHYIYAVLHSPNYRKRYAEFLKIDFPRIPLPTDVSAFAALVRLGRKLSGLHLLETELESAVTFPQAGLNVVDKPRFAANKVWINDTQYFDGIPETLWQTRIGGYQVLEKWLKDRKGRELGFDDINHYCQVAAALEQTQELMAQTDLVA